MSYEASASHQELLDLEGELRRQLRELGRARRPVPPAPRDALAQLRRLCHAFRTGVGRMGAQGWSTYGAAVAAHEDALAGLQAQLHAVATQADLCQAQGRGGPSPLPPSTAPSAPLSSPPDTDALARQRIGALQQNALAALARTELWLNKTEAVAGETTTLLCAQTEQIQGAHARLQGTREELRQASQELKAFMRRMMRDRVIVFMLVLIVICLIILVVVSIAKHTL